MLVKLAAISCLLLLLYQDLRYRAVNWIIYPILLIVLLALSFQSLSWELFLLNSVYNLAFILLQLVLLTCYFSLKNKKWINLTKAYLGWGDILFFATAAFYLSPLNYIAFYMISLMGISIITVSMLFRYAASDIKIPLAGLQAAWLAILMLADWNLANVNLLSDDYLLELIQQ